MVRSRKPTVCGSIFEEHLTFQSTEMISFLLFNAVLLVFLYNVYRYMFFRPSNFPPGNMNRSIAITGPFTRLQSKAWRKTLSPTKRTAADPALRQLSVHASTGQHASAVRREQIVPFLSNEHSGPVFWPVPHGHHERRHHSEGGAPSTRIRWEAGFVPGPIERAKHGCDGFVSGRDHSSLRPFF